MSIRVVRTSAVASQPKRAAVRELGPDVEPLTDVSYWLARQESDISLPFTGRTPSWYDRARPFLPSSAGSRCLEVGVVPGSTLLFLALKHRYACVGIDLSPAITRLEAAFAEHGVKAQFIQEDFLCWRAREQFDLVYSCGFIEHFQNFHPVIQKHWSLVRPGGVMLLSVPTLTPVQWVVRRIVYDRQRMSEMLASHNPRIMSLPALRACARQCAGCEILVSSYTSEMRFWFGPTDPGIRRWSRPLFGPLRLMERAARHSRWSSRWFSPEAFVLVRKVS